MEDKYNWGYEDKDNDIKTFNIYYNDITIYTEIMNTELTYQIGHDKFIKYKRIKKIKRLIDE